MNPIFDKIFDFNIHLPKTDNGLHARHLEDLKMGVFDLMDAHSFYQSELSNIIGANIMLFNQTIALENDFNVNFSRFNQDLLDNSYEEVVYTALFNFDIENWREYLVKLNVAGVHGIKFHSYIQNIDESKFEKILYICKVAEELKMFICIDTSYGTTGLYKYDNLKLAAVIANIISKVPIILLHSGGARILDAMLIADHQSNVYLETSLTMPYYKGATIWKDLAFAYKKLGTHRILYATDFPYITLEDSLMAHSEFFDKYKFSTKDVESIMCNNASKLVG